MENKKKDVYARWEHDRDNNRHDQLEIVKCSNCGVEAFAAALFVRYGNYCPYCGAKMEDENKSNLCRRNEILPKRLPVNLNKNTKKK